MKSEEMEGGRRGGEGGSNGGGEQGGGGEEQGEGRAGVTGEGGGRPVGGGRGEEEGGVRKGGGEGGTVRSKLGLGGGRELGQWEGGMLEQVHLGGEMNIEELEHFLTRTIKDFIVRYKMLKGHKVKYIMGVDLYGKEMEEKAMKEALVTLFLFVCMHNFHLIFVHFLIEICFPLLYHSLLILHF